KQWSLTFAHNPTRATLSGQRGRDAFVLQVSGSGLVGSTRYNLLSGENTLLDEPADVMVCYAEPLRGLCHREPLAIFLGGMVCVDVMLEPHRHDTARSPGFALTSGYAHAVQRGGDVRI